MPNGRLDDHALDASIIIPAYNAEHYIQGAIQSVQAQTMSDLEIIVVDDASTDGTAAVVQALSGQDGRVRYARMATNSGPAASRNHGLRLARGEWVAMLDADDRFHPRRLETLLALGRREDADMVSDNVLLVSGLDQTGRRMISETALRDPKMLSFREFMEGCHVEADGPNRTSYVFMHPMFRRKFLENHQLRYNELSRNGEDFLLYLDCLVAKARWYISPEPMYTYLVRRDSLTEKLSREDQRRMIDRVRHLSWDPGLRQDKRLKHALTRYWKLVAPNYYYYSFKDAVRAADFSGMWRILSRDRAAGGLVLRELLRRSPAIGRKLARRARARTGASARKRV